MATVEALILANHAEVQNGLLYLSGGGWSELYRPVPQSGEVPRNHFGVAVVLGVSWNETNVPHEVTVAVEDLDGAAVVEMKAGFTVGRPPTLPQGSAQLTTIALSLDIVFPRPGEYCLVGRIGTEPTRTVPFRVHDIPTPAQMPAA
jgi:hypothetical protein